MLVPNYSDRFSIEIIHRKAHIGKTAEIYQMNEGEEYVLDIGGTIGKVKGKLRGKKNELVRKPYVGMQILFHLKESNRKLVVSEVDLQYKQAKLSENGKPVPCRLHWDS